MNLGRLFQSNISFDHGWFRLFGAGLGWKDTRKHALLFSERYGYTPYWKIGAWAVKRLPRYRS